MANKPTPRFGVARILVRTIYHKARYTLSTCCASPQSGPLCLRCGARAAWTFIRAATSPVIYPPEWGRSTETFRKSLRHNGLAGAAAANSGSGYAGLFAPIRRCIFGLKMSLLGSDRPGTILFRHLGDMCAAWPAFWKRLPGYRQGSVNGCRRAWPYARGPRSGMHALAPRSGEGPGWLATSGEKS